ncbi:hypothetical protein MKX01_032629 [Papaver californicum]|nr:hypothetical protein MKX01_032629 [Papaver californicum]
MNGILSSSRLLRKQIQKFDGNRWYSPPCMDSSLRLTELHDPTKGYIVNDTCVITIEVSVDDDGVEEIVPGKDAKTGFEDEKTSGGDQTGAGQHFDKGQHNRKVGFGEDNEFEDVGGFSILKTQVPIYKQIWLKYGHIPSTKVVPISSYNILVMVVKDLMTSITAMHQCRYVELSSEMIEGWEEMLKMAEKFEFNIGWLQERLESVKKGLGGMQKVKTELLELGQPLRAAKSRVRAASDELKKAEAQLISEKENLRQKVSGLLPELDMEMYLAIGENLLLDGLF